MDFFVVSLGSLRIYGLCLNRHRRHRSFPLYYLQSRKASCSTHIPPRLSLSFSFGHSCWSLFQSAQLHSLVVKGSACFDHIYISLMPGHSQRSPSQRSFRLSNHGFQPLNAVRDDNMANHGNNIPLQTVVSHTPSPALDEKQSEKTGMFNGISTRGRRQLAKVDSRTGAPLPPREVAGQEKTALNKMGRLYTKILNFSIVTRYMIYVAPIALLLAIPIILSQTKAITGGIGDTEPRRFWIWIEISMFTLNDPRPL